MDTGQNNLFETGGCHALDFAQDAIERHAARLTSRCRDDAVGAGLRAPGLHPKRERRPAGNAWLDRRAATAVAVAKTFSGRKVRLKPDTTFALVRLTSLRQGYGGPPD